MVQLRVQRGKARARILSLVKRCTPVTRVRTRSILHNRMIPCEFWPSKRQVLSLTQYSSSYLTPSLSYLSPSFPDPHGAIDLTITNRIFPHFHAQSNHLSETVTSDIHLQSFLSSSLGGSTSADQTLPAGWDDVDFSWLVIRLTEAIHHRHD